MSVFYDKVIDSANSGTWSVVDSEFTLDGQSLSGIRLGQYVGSVTVDGLDGGGWEVEGLFALGWKPLSGALTPDDIFQLDVLGVQQLKVKVVAPGALAAPRVGLNLMTRSI